MLAGLLTLTTTNLTLNLPYIRDRDAVSLLQVREYIETHDATIFTRDPQHPGPHPDPSAVLLVLDDPLLRNFLPAEFFDSVARLPRLIQFSPSLGLISALALILIVIPWFPPTKST